MLAAIGQPMAKADHHRITKSFRQPILKNVNTPLTTLAMMAVSTTGKMNLASPSMRPSVPLRCGTGQQSKLPRQLCRSSLSGVDHLDRAAVPAVFDGKSYDIADAYEPQPKFNVAAEIFEAWLRDSFEASRFALSPDVRNESLVNAQ